MPKRDTALLNQLTKGFLTERSALTLPPDACTDEYNMFLKRDGTREKRLGLNLQEGASLITSQTLVNIQPITLAGLTARPVITYKWRSVNGNPDLNLLVAQIDGVLFFFEAGVSPLNSGLINDAIDLIDAAVDGLSDDVRNTRSQFASGRGKLFVVNRYINPSYITYDADEQTFTLTQYTVKVRDLQGVDDGLEVDERPSTLSTEHHYNLRNQGWLEDAVKVWNNKGQKSADPVLAFNEYVAKNGDSGTD